MGLYKLWVLQYQSGSQIQMRILNFSVNVPYFDFNNSAADLTTFRRRRDARGVL